MNFDWIWMISYQKGISKIDNDYYSVSSKIYELYHEKCSKMEADIVREILYIKECCNDITD